MPVAPVELLSPLQWSALKQANAVLIDCLLNSLEDLARGEPLDQVEAVTVLPAAFLEHYDEQFLRRFLVCLVTVGARVQSAGRPAWSCLAEEVALVATVRLAEGMLDQHDAPPAFARWLDVVCAGSGVAALFVDETNQGGERARGSEVVGYRHVQHWFAPLRGAALLHPYLETEPDAG